MKNTIRKSNIEIYPKIHFTREGKFGVIMLVKSVKSLILSTILTVAISVQASEKIPIAILDLDALEGIPPTTAISISEFLRDQFFKTGRFTVIEKKKMEDVLKEQAYQKSGCTTTECAVEIGKLLNVRQVVTGSVTKLGAKYSILVRFVDVETGEQTYSETGQCDTQERLIETAKDVALRLSAQVPMMGKIMSVTGDEVIVNIGMIDNVKPGDTYEVERYGDLIGGFQKKEKIGKIKLDEVQKEASNATIIEKKKDLQEGDIVKVAAAARSATRESMEITQSVSGKPSALTPMLYSMILPGLGQYHNGQGGKGLLIQILEAGAIGGAVFFYMQGNTNWDKYMAAATATEATKFYNDADNNYKMSNYFQYAAIGIYAYNVLDALLSAGSSGGTSSNKQENNIGLSIGSSKDKDCSIGLNFKF